jgi:hypothetical protein
MDLACVQTISGFGRPDFPRRVLSPRWRARFGRVESNREAGAGDLLQIKAAAGACQVYPGNDERESLSRDAV